WRVVDVAPILAEIKTAPDRLRPGVVGSTLLANALSAGRLGNAVAAEVAAGGLRDLEASMKARKAPETKKEEIMVLEADGMALLAAGVRKAPVKKLDQPAATEESMNPPPAPPAEQNDDRPIKRAHELP